MKIVLGALPKDLPASVFLITHAYQRERSLLAPLLRHISQMPVRTASEGAAIEKGVVYVAAPDRHLLLAKDHLHLSHGPKEGLHRPSINATFRSAAHLFGPRVIGIVLSGMLDDGASGLWEIARHRGITIVQDPNEATFPSMPLNAVQDAPVDYTLPSTEIAPVVTQLVEGRRVPPSKNHARTLDPARITSRENARENFSGFTCPECQGPLSQIRKDPPEFRCRVGHIFQLDNLQSENGNSRERKMYQAMIALEEGADLADYAARRAKQTAKTRLRRESKQLRSQVRALRDLLEDSPA